MRAWSEDRASRIAGTIYDPRSALLIDSHCHLDAEQFDSDRDEVLARATAAGVAIIVNPGVDLASSRRAIALTVANRNIYAAVAVHPTSADDLTSAALAELRQLAAHPRVVAIGEIGLDYYWPNVADRAFPCASPATQRQAFRQQLDLAADVGKPVIIHNRDAHTDVEAMLNEWAHTERTQQSPLAERADWGVLHAFSGDVEMARRAESYHFLIGIGGPITYKNARNVHHTMQEMSLSRLIVETDAPYLAPIPYRGQRNEPAYVALVAQAMARLKGLTLEQVAGTTTENAQRLFGLTLAIDR